MLVRRGGEQAGALGAAQPVGEHVRGHAAEVAAELGEAPGPAGQGSDEQQRPAVTDQIDGAAQIRIVTVSVAITTSVV